MTTKKRRNNRKFSNHFLICSNSVYKLEAVYVEKLILALYTTVSKACLFLLWRTKLFA